MNALELHVSGFVLCELVLKAVKNTHQFRLSFGPGHDEFCERLPVFQQS